ncbi:hypothetical protein AF80_05335 [Aliarcobacter butzleri L355]|uniref:HTH cro/C1-type domain-containing protein n=1 Tax=Aliarcobacter butzleri L355 TaxID=1447263 RepID=A0A0G9KTN0_9BACT|nr:hypothetical protein [Aliarcobacter butzleri]KLE09947.1 hypothetical protein AF80_05335 [Aliarcobacter butzleri L355]MCT7646315.1 hypothetical protein [Aliarcobacter butzleri]
MEVWEKINYILKEKDISKQEFISKLLSLEPKLKRTDEIPSTQTVLGYLYGKRELKIELIPYIAEVLEVSEQELFTFDIEYATENNLRHSKEAREILYLLNFAPKPIIEHIKTVLNKYKKLHEESIKIIN